MTFAQRSDERRFQYTPTRSAIQTESLTGRCRSVCTSRSVSPTFGFDVLSPASKRGSPITRWCQYSRLPSGRPSSRRSVRVRRHVRTWGACCCCLSATGTHRGGQPSSCPRVLGHGCLVVAHEERRSAATTRGGTCGRVRAVRTGCWRCRQMCSGPRVLRQRVRRLSGRIRAAVVLARCEP
jgi:hypothetical protein